MRSFRILLLLAAGLLLAGCQAAPPSAAPPEAEETTAGTQQDPELVRVTFSVQLPAELAPGQEVMIEFLDEITGLAIVPVRVPLERIDSVNYRVSTDLPDKSIVKYRFFRKGENPSVEINALGKAVRYRFLFTPLSGEVREIVAGWNDVPTGSAAGMIEGRIINSGTRYPAAGVLVSCGGDQVVTDAFGIYRFERVKPGTHTLSAMSMDGSAYPFQQEAVVAANSRTLADFEITPAPRTEVHFLLDTTGGETGNYPIRIIGDLSQAGNTFSNQGADQSVLADLAVDMNPAGGGIYEAVLQLPRDMVFSYKYSLGDGLWNSERDPDGGLVSRKVLITGDTQEINDTLRPVGKGDGSSVSFFLKVPDNTPEGDRISIQFNPFDWSPSLPIVKSGENRFQYTLYGPQDLLGELTYRYCRNLSCQNIPFSSGGAAPAFSGSFLAQAGEQQIVDEISSWPDWQPSEGPTVVHAASVVPRNAAFIAGMETQPAFNPAAKGLTTRGLDASSRSGANTLFLTPTWHILSPEPLAGRQIPGFDPSLEDIAYLASEARLRNLKVGLFPRILAGGSSGDMDPAGWNSISPNQWSDLITRFYHHFARAASLNACEFLIVDGEYLDWRYEPGLVELVINIRQQFKGKLLLAATPEGIEWYPEAMLEQFDSIYLLLECPLTSTQISGNESSPASITSLLDGKIHKLATEKNMPVVVGVRFPAVDDAAETCYRMSSEWIEMRDRFPDPADQPANLQAQSDLYNEVLAAAAGRGWITGVVSRGFVMESASTGSTASVYGKPAADILWYWFSILRN